MKTLKFVYHFIIEADTKHSEEDLKNKILELFRLFFLNFFLVIIIMVPVGILRLKFNLHPQGVDLPLFTYIVINIIIIPIIEESAFRLTLIYNKIFLSISTMIISFIFISYLITGELISPANLYLRLLYSIAIAVILYLFIKVVPKIDSFFSSFWVNHQRLILYFFVFLFVAMHIKEYTFPLQQLPVVLLILTPKLVTGIFLSYTRMRLGFTYSILLHIIINIVAMGLIFV